MTRQTAKALNLPAVHDLIEAPGAWLDEVKQQELRRPGLKQAELKERYARLATLIETLRGRESELRTLRELLAHIPKWAPPARPGIQPWAVHECFLLKEFLYHYGRLLAYIRARGWMDQFLLPDLEQVFKLLDPEAGGLPAFRVSGAYSEKLAQILVKRLELGNRLQHARAHYLEEARAELRLPQLLEEFVLSRTQTELAERILHSPFYILASESVANLSFILADDDNCLELKKQLSLLAQQQRKEESRVLRELSRQLNAELPRVKTAQNVLHQAGWRFLLADFALRHSCCLPQLGRGRRIRIQGAVNLPLKLHLESLGRHFQKVDYDFDRPVSLLTGPNMGGKTTILRTVGQFCALARQGIPLPCEKAEIPLFDQIWYNQEETESNADLSSFGREVVSFTQALQEEGLTLFLLDEFARGTNPAEGGALSSAVLSFLATTRHMCVAATHFTAPALLEGLAHFSIAGIDSQILDQKSHQLLSPTQRVKALSEAMDYKLRRLRRNQAPPLCAIRVARVLGLPEAILKHLKDLDQ